MFGLINILRVISMSTKIQSKTHSEDHFSFNSIVIMKLSNFCRTSLTWAKLKIQNNQYKESSC